MEGILQPSRSDGGWGLIRALGRVSRWEPTLGLSPSSSEWPHLPPFPSRSSRPGRRMHGAGRRLPWQRHHGNVTMATAPWQRGRDGTRPGDARCAALRSDRHDHGTEPGRDSEPVKLPGDSSHAGVSSTLRRDTTKGWKGDPSGTGCTVTILLVNYKGRKDTKKDPPLLPLHLISPGLMSSCK